MNKDLMVMKLLLSIDNPLNRTKTIMTTMMVKRGKNPKPKEGTTNWEEIH